MHTISSMARRQRPRHHGIWLSKRLRDTKVKDRLPDALRLSGNPPSGHHLPYRLPKRCIPFIDIRLFHHQRRGKTHHVGSGIEHHAGLRACIVQKNRAPDLCTLRLQFRAKSAAPCRGNIAENPCSSNRLQMLHKLLPLSVNAL